MKEVDELDVKLKNMTKNLLTQSQKQNVTDNEIDYSIQELNNQTCKTINKKK